MHRNEETAHVGPITGSSLCISCTISTPFDDAIKNFKEKLCYYIVDKTARRLYVFCCFPLLSITDFTETCMHFLRYFT